MTAKELIENMDNLIKAYAALEKEFKRRSDILRDIAEENNEKPKSERG